MSRTPHTASSRPSNNLKKQKKFGFDKIVFFNFYNNGDIHVSREYVKYIMQNIPAKEYIYAHKNPEKMLLDIDKLNYDKNLLDSLHPLTPYCLKNHENGEQVLYLNTWYRNSSIFDQYHCSLNTLHNLFDGFMKDIFHSRLPDDITKFIPKINFRKYKIANITKFVKKNKAHKIFIANNDVLSGQSSNFDFNPVIDKLSEKHPDILFFISNKIPDYDLKKPNVIYTSDLIGIAENDLNENAYLTTFCDIIIGRASGAYTFSYIRDNLMNEKKLFICFCENQVLAFWAQPPGLTKAKIIWSNDYNINHIFHTINKAIRNYYCMGDADNELDTETDAVIEDHETLFVFLQTRGLLDYLPDEIVEAFEHSHFRNKFFKFLSLKKEDLLKRLKTQMTSGFLISNSLRDDFEKTASDFFRSE